MLSVLVDIVDDLHYYCNEYAQISYCRPYVSIGKQWYEAYDSHREVSRLQEECVVVDGGIKDVRCVHSVY